MFEISTIY